MPATEAYKPLEDFVNRSLQKTVSPEKTPVTVRVGDIIPHCSPNIPEFALLDLKQIAIENDWLVEHHDRFFRFNGILDFYSDLLRKESKKQLQGITAEQARIRNIERLRIEEPEDVGYCVEPPIIPLHTTAYSYNTQPFIKMVAKYYKPKLFARPANWLTANDFSGDPLPSSEFFWAWEEIKG